MAGSRRTQPVVLGIMGPRRIMGWGTFKKLSAKDKKTRAKMAALLFDHDRK